MGVVEMDSSAKKAREEGEEEREEKARVLPGCLRECSEYLPFCFLRNGLQKGKTEKTTTQAAENKRTTTTLWLGCRLCLPPYKGTTAGDFGIVSGDK